MLLSSFKTDKKKERKTAAFELPGSKKGLADRIQAMHLIDICARAQNWAIFVAEDFGLAKLPAVLIGLAVILRRQPTFYWDHLVQERLNRFRKTIVRAHTVRWASRSTACQGSEGLIRQLYMLSFEKKKQPLVNRKIQEPSERDWFLQEDATGELERVATDERTSLFSG